MRAVKCLKNGRSVGADGIANELLKYIIHEDNLELGHHIASPLNQIFVDGKSFEEIGEGLLIPLHKPNKPKGPVKNLRPVVLLNAIRKVLAIIVLKRIEFWSNDFIPRSQSAFRKGHSTADIFFAKRLLTGMVLNKDLNISILGIDLSRAFDTIDRKTLLEIIRPQETVEGGDDLSRLVHILLLNTAFKVRISGKRGIEFQTTIGSPQGDSLSPVLFNFYYEAALKEVTKISRKTEIGSRSRNTSRNTACRRFRFYQHM